MFYSATLLTTSGPLARAWLSANQTKMSKVQILQTNLEDSVQAIITPEGDAPLALRLSGQLLVGVVRIYGRKARYLLDDCNEALMKIKMAFRSTANHDIPVNLQVIQNKESLMLPDRITPYDNLDVLPSMNMDLFTSQMMEMSATPVGRKGRASNREINLQEDFNNSQFLRDSADDDDGLGALNLNLDGDLDLDLDFGDDIDERPTKLMDKSIELGRDAPAARGVEDDILSVMDGAGPSKFREESLGLDLDFGDHDNEGDIQMGDDFDFGNFGDQSAMPGELSIAPVGRARLSESPLSDIDEAFAREVELEYSRNMTTDMYEPGDDTTKTIVAPQRQKKRKLLQPDEQTMISSAQIKEQQTKRDNILRPQSFIPHDPYILGLMDLQKSGAFVTNILLEGRSDGWAPELKGLLSLSAIRPNDLKRKRDSGIADMDSDEEQLGKSPRLEIPEDESLAVGGTGLGHQSLAADGTVLELPGDDDMMFHNGDDDTRHEEREGPAFDETTAPIVHPADSGAVSIGTKHAVHILRDLFGSEAATNADKRKKASVVFQELLPETTTTKADATKMFFECLVLATKDAIKVEQPEGSLGGPIRVRGKRGLWGEWAEREAGGEIAHQDEQQSLDGPQPAVASTATVAVEA
ncbi:hypothetical protein GQ53DRAFT_389792 [Thozetella sp. PMI_491]|nr:hypothetical protein GQ53DRAFT_389792 [Thozetella sp. PMI_491]